MFKMYSMEVGRTGWDGARGGRRSGGELVRFHVETLGAEGRGAEASNDVDINNRTKRGQGVSARRAGRTSRMREICDDYYHELRRPRRLSRETQTTTKSNSRSTEMLKPREKSKERRVR